MAMRLSGFLYDTLTKTFARAAMRAQQLADLPVGQCDCHGRVHLLEMSPPFRRGSWSLTLACRGCGAEAAVFGMPRDADQAEPVEREPVVQVPLAVVQLELELCLPPCVCRWCTGPLPARLAVGRPRRYCKDACRREASRARRASVVPRQRRPAGAPATYAA